MTDTAQATVRLDKWLWAARFFKTRSLATDAVESGKIKLNGERPKPAKAVKIRDSLDVRTGPYTFAITVLGLSDKRGPAPVAQKLYAESTESLAARQLLSQQLHADAATAPLYRGRPTKKARRQIVRFVAQLDD